MYISKNIFCILVLIASAIFIGCVGESVTVVQERFVESFDLSKGIVYNIDLWVKNEADVSTNAKITVELIAKSTGEVRDSQTKTVYLAPSATKKVTFTLDGESGVEYTYKYYVN